jgi:hypothetical protein
MEPTLLAKVIGTLFSPQEDTAQDTTRTAKWNVEWEVSEEKLWEATRGMASRDLSSGPDGIPGLIWREAMGVMASKLRCLYTRCLRERVYPRVWRTAIVVILRKEG